MAENECSHAHLPSTRCSAWEQHITLHLNAHHIPDAVSVCLVPSHSQAVLHFPVPASTSLGECDTCMNRLLLSLSLFMEMAAQLFLCFDIFLWFFTDEKAAIFFVTQSRYGTCFALN